MLALSIESLIKIGVMIGCLMGATSYLVLVERWVAAWLQDRRGPNRAGIPMTDIRLFGLGQPIADGVKFIFKEEFTPRHVSKALYFLAPAIMFIGALSAFAVVPFGSVLPSIPLLAKWGFSDPIRLMAAPGLDVGMIYMFAVGSVAVYGVLLGGWASNNKYSLMGGLRSGAAMISYELPLGLGILGVVLLAGSLRLDVIIAAQADSGYWNVMVQPLGFFVFAVAAFAEAGRLPFDLAEAEQELVAGYHTEYSGMKLMMYLVGEYLHMIAASFLMVILFFGGWHLWGLTDGIRSPGGEEITWLVALLRVVVLLSKTLGVIVFFMVARWSWPRFRFDQLMTMAWKVMLPLGLVNIVVVACWFELTGSSGGPIMAAFGWIVLFASWLAVTLIVPGSCDNRPRLESVHAYQETDDRETGQTAEGSR